MSQGGTFADVCPLVYFLRPPTAIERLESFIQTSSETTRSARSGAERSRAELRVLLGSRLKIAAGVPLVLA